MAIPQKTKEARPPDRKLAVPVDICGSVMMSKMGGGGARGGVKTLDFTYCIWCILKTREAAH